MLDEIVTVVKKCGDIILFADGAERNVSSKEGRANFVTKYDGRFRPILRRNC